jgi:hypothetical protein
MDIGVVTGDELGKNFDSEGDVRLLQVQIGEDDTQLIEMGRIAGIDYNPPDDSAAFFVKIFESGKFVVATDDGITPSAEKGELKLYSSEGGTKKSEIHLVADGSLTVTGGNGEAITVAGGEITISADKIILSSDDIEVGGNADFAVRFNELKTQFDILKKDVNNHINVTYMTHNHPTAAPGSPSPPSVPGVPTTADISGAKVDTVKLP